MPTLSEVDGEVILPQYLQLLGYAFSILSAI
jgi:hypothetical protein